jgi:hypothetical protein
LFGRYSQTNGSFLRQAVGIQYITPFSTDNLQQQVVAKKLIHSDTTEKLLKALMLV